MLNKRKYSQGALQWIAAMIISVTPAAAAAGPQMTFGPDNQGMLQIDYKGQFQMIVRDTGSGQTGEDSTAQFNFRRNRLAFMGAYGDTLGLYVQTEFSEDEDITALSVRSDAAPSEFQILDAVMRFNFNDAFRVNVGKFKYNLSRENLEACEAPLTLDRSLFIRAPFVTTRDKGVAVWGNVGDGLFQYRIDAMNGRLATTADAPAPQSNFRYSVRVHLSVLEPEKEYGYKGTYLGQKKVLTIGGAVQYEADAAFAETVTMADPKDYKAWTADVFFEYPFPSLGTITLSGAYEKISFDNAYRGSNPDPGTIDLTGEKNGYYAKAGYLLPATPLQVFARFEKWSFATLNNIVDQALTWAGAGVNYYINKQSLKLTLEYSRTDFDKEGTFGGLVSKDFNTFITQLQFIF